MSDVTTTDLATPADANVDQTPAAPSTTTEPTTPPASSLPGGEPDTKEGGDTSLPGSETKPDGEESEQRQGAPERYEAFTLPDGSKMPEESTEVFSEIAKRFGLSQLEAQELMSLSNKTQADKASADKQADEDEVKGWQAETKKEFGDKYAAEYAKANKAYEIMFEDAAFRETLNQSGITSHPSFFKALAKIGDTISEDSIVKGDGKTKGSNEGGIKGFFADLNK